MALSLAPVAQLKARLSEFLARVRGGEEIIVTDRGRPVAKLVPLSGPSSLEGHLAGLARAGHIREPRTSLDATFLEQPRAADPAGRSLDTVLEDRGEGW